MLSVQNMSTRYIWYDIVSSCPQKKPLYHHRHHGHPGHGLWAWSQEVRYLLQFIKWIAGIRVQGLRQIPCSTCRIVGLQSASEPNSLQSLFNHSGEKSPEERRHSSCRLKYDTLAPLLSRGPGYHNESGKWATEGTLRADIRIRIAAVRNQQLATKHIAETDYMLAISVQGWVLAWIDSPT